MFQCCMCTLPSYDCPPPPHVSMYDRWVWPVSDMYDRWAWTVSDMYDRWAWTVTCIIGGCDLWVTCMTGGCELWVTCMTGEWHVATHTLHQGPALWGHHWTWQRMHALTQVARRKDLRSEEKYDFPGVWPGMDKSSWMTWTRRSPSLPTKIGSKAPYTRQFEWRWTKCIGILKSMHSWCEGNWYFCIIV